MEKPTKIFEQRKDESDAIENFNMKNDTRQLCWEKGKGGGGIVAQNDSFMVIRTKPKYNQ